MLAMFAGALAILLAVCMASCWRDAGNWSADAENGTLRFGAWAELFAFGVLLAASLVGAALFAI